MDTTQTRDPRLLFPGLASFYACASNLWYPLIRVTAGGILFVHGWLKIDPGATPVAATIEKIGLQPAVSLAYFVIFLETVGAAAIVAGLFTRVFAAAIAIEMAVIVFLVQLPRGFIASRGGYEFVLMWGILMLAIALRGGGPYSLDRKIGVEL